MTTQPQVPSGPPRVPLLASVSQRGESVKLDARLINGYVEKLQNGDVVAIKRPGLVGYRDFAGGGFGCYYWNGSVFAIVNGRFWKDGTDIGAVNSAGGFYSFSSNSAVIPSLFFHNTTNAYYYSSTGGLTAVGAPPGNGMLLGAAFLDGTMYVLEQTVAVRGSDINNLATWSALNVIKAQMLPEPGKAIFRQLSYVVVLKEASMEGFYDNANPVGSPLAKAEGVFMPYGCRNARSLQVIEDSALWVTSGQSGVTVMMLENMKPKIVSTPPVERLFQQLAFTNVYSWSFRLYGHRFYVITEKDANLTLVYDLSTDEWFQWTNSAGNYLDFIACTNTSDSQALVQDEAGKLWKIEGTITNDNGNFIPFEIITPIWDGGTQTDKVLTRMDALTDQNANGILSIRVSDDDYKTWSNWRTINLGKNEKSLHDCGTFKRRAWHVRYTANTTLRLKALELNGIMLGDG